MKRILVLVGMLVLLFPSAVLADGGLNVDIVVIGDSPEVDVDIPGDEAEVGVDVTGENSNVYINGRNVNDPVAVHVRNNYSDDSGAYRRLKARVEIVENLFGQFSDTLMITVDATAKTIVELTGLQGSVALTDDEVAKLRADTDLATEELRGGVGGNSGKIDEVARNLTTEVDRTTTLSLEVEALKESLLAFQVLAIVVSLTLLAAIIALFILGAGSEKKAS